MASNLPARSLFLLIVLGAQVALSRVEGSGTPTFTHGIVVAAESLAAQVGVDVLRRGGNAVDAAVAVGFALGVTFPEAGNIGGGGFMLIRLKDGRSTMIDFREKAPAAATKDMFLDSLGQPDTLLSQVGALSVGVPGTVAGLLTALESYGSVDRADVLRDAIALAEDGFPVSERLAESLKGELKNFFPYPSTMKVFTKDGIPYEAGDILRQPELGEVLRAISKKGKPAFYGGRVAEAIARQMNNDRGLIAITDLKAYQAVERTPLEGTYRGLHIVAPSPPSAGGVVLLEVLNILEGFHISSLGWNSCRTAHLLAAAFQRAYADRARFLGDPDFVHNPVEVLVSKKYAAKRRAEIDSVKASPSEVIEEDPMSDSHGNNTTHYCVADEFGNVVSTTYTLNSLYGSKLVVDGTGVLLNNEMDDFVAKPGFPNQFGLVGGEENSIAPNKRMLSSMTPTIVLKEGKPLLCVGARGGSRITTAVAQVILNVVDFNMGVAEAVSLPRIHHQWLPDILYFEPHGLAANVQVELTSMGYRLEESESMVGKCEALFVDPVTGFFLGGPGPREKGVALGY